MRTAILLSVLAALAAVALAAPPSPPPQQPAEQPSQPPVRHRRFVLLGWDLGRFLADLDRQVHRAWAAGTHWARRLLHWSHGRLPQQETVYDLSLPGGGVGVVRIISFSAQHPRRGPLVWDGKRLAWQHQQHGDGNLLTLDHNGMHHAIRLDALARYLRDVPAGSKVRAEVLGSGWRKLRIVLHVVGKHGKEDASKSVSILVSELIEKHWSHGHRASSHGHRKSSKSHEKSSHSHEKSSHSHGKSSQSYEKSSNSIESHSKKSSHNEVGHKSSGSEESHKHDKSNHHLAVQLEKHHSKESRRSSSHSSGSSTSASGKSKKSSTGLVWDGQSLSWADGVGAAGKSKKVNRRLRITQDGVTHVIPLSVVAQHLGDVAAGSEISLEIVGKKLKNLQIVLHVHGAQGQGADKTITLKAIDLIREIDEKRATVLPGRKTKKGKSIPLLGSILFTTTTTPRPGR